MNRRNFLVGTGGLALALPWLEKHAAADDAGPPKRLVVFFHEAGTLIDEWRPTGTGTEFELSEILSPLQPFKDQLTIVSGLWNHVRWLDRIDNHEDAKMTLLTGQGYFDPGAVHSWANGPSLDRVIADRMPVTARKTLDVLAGVNNTGWQGVVSFSGPNEPVTSRFNNPLDLYQDFIGAIPPTDPAAAAAAAALRARRHSVLDAVQDNFALYRRSLGAADRQRLDAHADYIRAIEERLDATAAANCMPPAAPGAIEFVNDHGAALQQHADLLAVALACDITRVSTVYVQTQQSASIGGIAIPGGNWHNFVHEGPGEPGSADRDIRRQVFRWHYEQLAYLLERLASMPEGDGTVLDNTLVLALSEFGNAADHDQDGHYGPEAEPDRGLPVVLAGKLGGALETGRHVSYEWPGRSHSDLLLSILRLFGHDDETFGMPEHCAGTLPELV